MIIFESLSTTFYAYIIFRGSCGSSEDWLEPKTLTIRRFNQAKLAQICETLGMFVLEREREGV